MNIRCLSAVLLLTLAAPAMAGAVYQWTDAQGNVHFGDNPAQGAKKLNLDPADGSAPPQDAAAREAQRAADCSRKRDQLTTFKSAARIVEKDALGNEHEYTGDERTKLIELTQKQVDTACSDQPPPA
ncbi:MAG TPA: DUF4124 domain-containing protein, partial [Stenotrophobium sp.]|nr:DUF4124 domain-containing protein [Stenotrophobium sp.]